MHSNRKSVVNIKQCCSYQFCCFSVLPDQNIVFEVQFSLNNKHSIKENREDIAPTKQSIRLKFMPC